MIYLFGIENMAVIDDLSVIGDLTLGYSINTNQKVYLIYPRNKEFLYGFNTLVHVGFVVSEQDNVLNIVCTSKPDWKFVPKCLLGDNVFFSKQEALIRLRHNLKLQLTDRNEWFKEEIKGANSFISEIKSLHPTKVKDFLEYPLMNKDLSLYKGFLWSFTLEYFTRHPKHVIYQHGILGEEDQRYLVALPHCEGVSDLFKSALGNTVFPSFEEAFSKFMLTLKQYVANMERNIITTTQSNSNTELAIQKIEEYMKLNNIKCGD